MGFFSVFLSQFCSLEDLRQTSKVTHPLPEIFLLTLFGVVCGCDGWADIERYGKAKLPLLREFLPYAGGIPSDDTLRRFFARLDPDALRDCFVSFVASLFPQAGERLIAIDGKTSRGSRDGDGKALHTVSAFASEARLVLAQVATQEKSNEITAIPQLLDLLDVAGATVSIDAMGCQKEIAQKIVDKGGDYVLSLKGNQGTLHGCAKTLFKDADLEGSVEESGKGHGREETRRCDVTPAGDVAFLREIAPWPELKSVARVVATRVVGGISAVETRYYLSSLPPDAARIAHAVRSHWGIENSLHWVPDVTFGEDGSRIRKDNSPFVMAVIRHIAVNLIQAVKKNATPWRAYASPQDGTTLSLKEFSVMVDLLDYS
jgi:predicted transposase YbfD/YdcC